MYIDNNNSLTWVDNQNLNGIALVILRENLFIQKSHSVHNDKNNI